MPDRTGTRIGTAEERKHRPRPHVADRNQADTENNQDAVMSEFASILVVFLAIALAVNLLANALGSV
ncbi:MAG: hypothetical protein HYR63_27060 [Proteobacteria bacterium]|nr:hypothetical protein [Pseudomonadota bacterium]